MVFRTRGRDERGASAVEFALVIPLLLVVIFGIIQYSWYFYAMQSGTSAVGDVVRRLSVGACQTSGERVTLLTSDLGAALSGGITVNSVTYTTASGGASGTPVVGGSVKLTVTFPTMNLHFPFVPVPNGGSVTRVQKARVESAVAATGVTCS